MRRSNERQSDRTRSQRADGDRQEEVEIKWEQMMGWDRCKQSNIVPLVVNGVSFPGGIDSRLKELAEALLAETERMGYPLHKDWCWGYYCKQIAGSTTWSNHAYGKAIDINAPANSRGTQGNVPLSVVNLWESYGWTWGGRWSYTDPMHFEFNGSTKAARRKTNAVQKDLVPVTPAYRIKGGTYRKLNRAISQLKGRLHKGDPGDKFHIKVVQYKKDNN